jgi:hypothetical protein
MTPLSLPFSLSLSRVLEHYGLEYACNLIVGTDVCVGDGHGHGIFKLFRMMEVAIALHHAFNKSGMVRQSLGVMA